MKPLASVQQGHNHACIEQDGLHRPKSRRCFLLDPKSEMPERNLPRPMTLCFFLRRRIVSRMRSPSRTTWEGVHPNSRTRAESLLRERWSSLAWITERILVLYYKKRIV